MGNFHMSFKNVTTDEINLGRGACDEIRTKTENVI